MAKLVQIAFVVVLVATTVLSRPADYGVKGGTRFGSGPYQPRGQYVDPAVDQSRQPDTYGKQVPGTPGNQQVTGDSTGRNEYGHNTYQVDDLRSGRGYGPVVDQGRQPYTYGKQVPGIPGNQQVTGGSTDRNEYGHNTYQVDDLRSGRGYGQHQSSDTEFLENNQRSRTDQFGSGRNGFSESARSGTRYGQQQDADVELIGSQHRSRSEDRYGNRDQFRESPRSDTHYGQNTDSQFLDGQRGYTEDLYANRDSTGSLRRENHYVYDQNARSNFAGGSTDDRYPTSVGQSRRNYGVKV